jgi:acetyltransferase
LPLTLRFGQRRCILRRLRAQDASKLLDFFKSLTPETVRLRYGYSGYVMTPEKAAQMAGVDQKKDAALAILEKDGTTSRIVAVGRYTLEPEGKSAEMAFVVHEDRRTLGMASALLEALTCIARQRKIERFRAQTFADNYAMLGIFLKVGARIKVITGTDGVEVNLPISGDGETK